jgi:hypothetical protein
MRNTAFHLFLDCYCFFVYLEPHSWTIFMDPDLDLPVFRDTDRERLLIFWLFDFLLVNIRILTKCLLFWKGTIRNCIWKFYNLENWFSSKITPEVCRSASVGWSMIIVSGSGYWLIFLTQFLYFDESHSKELIFFFTFSLILTIFFQEVDTCLLCLDKNISRFLNRNVENSVADPWHVGVDPDPRIHASD